MAFFTKENISRAGYASAAVLGLYSILETIQGNNEGFITEIIAFVALLIGLFVNAPKADKPANGVIE